MRPVVCYFPLVCSRASSVDNSRADDSASVASRSSRKIHDPSFHSQVSGSSQSRIAFIEDSSDDDNEKDSDIEEIASQVSSGSFSMNGKHLSKVSVRKEILRSSTPKAENRKKSKLEEKKTNQDMTRKGSHSKVDGKCIDVSVYLYFRELFGKIA